MKKGGPACQTDQLHMGKHLLNLSCLHLIWYSREFGFKLTVLEDLLPPDSQVVA